MKLPWTINDLTQEELGIDNLVCTVQNQDDDYCELRFPMDFDGDLPQSLVSATEIVVRYGNQIAIRGRVDSGSASGNGPVEYRSLNVYGPWHFMAATPCVLPFAYTGGNVSTTHAKFSGSAAAALAAILASAGPLIQIGHIDVGDVSIPLIESYDASIAEAIRSILKFISGAVVVFDYETSPPTCHVLRATSQYLQSVAVDPTDGEVSNLKLTPRDDLVLDGVQLHYEVPETRKTRTWYHKIEEKPFDETVVVKDGYAYLGSDVAGATTGRVLRKTIRLGGQRTVTALNWQVGNTGINLGDVLFRTTVPENWIWLDAFMAVNMPNHGPVDHSGTPTTHYKVYNFTAVSDSTTPPANASQANQWLSMQRIHNPLSGEPWDYDLKSLRKFPDEILYSAAYTAGLKVIKVWAEWSWTDVGGKSQISRGEQFFFFNQTGVQSPSGTRTVIEGVWDSMPTGIAQKILAENSTLFYDGGFTKLVEEEPLQFFALHRKVSIASPALSTIVQRFSLDVSTGLLDLTLGTPSHLGPQDHIALQRASLGIA